MPDPVIQVFVEFNPQGVTWEYLSQNYTWTQLQAFSWASFGVSSITNISSAVLQVSIERGRAEGIGQIVAGRATLVLDNEHRHFTPENSLSPYYPNLVPNRAIIVQANSTPLFRGFVDAWRIDPVVGNRTAVVEARDNTKELLRRRVDTPIFLDTVASSLIAIVFSHAGITDTATVDAITDVIPFAWFPDQEAYAALRGIVEAGAYTMYSRLDNKSFTIRNRTYNVSSSAPTASYVNAFYGLTYERSDDRLINTATVGGETRRIRDINPVGDVYTGPDPQLVVVARLKNTLEQNSGQQQAEIMTAPVGVLREFELEYVDPDNNEPSPCASLSQWADLLDGATGSVRVFDYGGNNITTQCSVTFTDHGDRATGRLYNAGPTEGLIERYEILGRPLQRQIITVQSAEVSSSQAEYGQRTVSLASPFFNLETYALGYAQYLTFRYHDLRPEVSMTLKNIWPDQITLDLLDVIHVVESHSAIGGAWQIMGIQHDITAARGLEHTTTYALDRWTPMALFVLDVDRLDTGRLGF